MPQITVTDSERLGELAAEQILQALSHRDHPVLGLATGSSPLSAYRALARLVAERGLDLSGLLGFALDEYVGLDPEHPESYHSVISSTVTEPLGLRPEQVRVPSGSADPAIECADFEAAILAAGGVDLQILGIGRNGHLGFNEPGSPVDSRTRIVPLTDETVSDNARFFDGDTSLVPRSAITQGLGTILDAQELIVIAIGSEKAAAVRGALEGPVSVDLPASVLRQHPRVHWYLDPLAAALLSEDTLAAAARLDAQAEPSAR
ncbi:glucosamine-6-phosphate deaminase [Leucobacter sp. M11]|uniref:glucosamine-6-phosphate deaminase n=1 Tax=Leucobacter sp. M11 TaxID=2993565 RepID=UPI002D7F9FF2|nr:glucosamine-6-phosphate deaminase [Leucobacter sp. M11]MEB4613452.1 glucosamine-6-phosphate deaminase [Leucobacter sp. M11]